MIVAFSQNVLSASIAMTSQTGSAKVFGNPTDPEVLFDNGWIHAKSACRLAEQVLSVDVRSAGNFIHASPLALFSGLLRKPNRLPFWCR
jgi:hypothetical protein